MNALVLGGNGFIGSHLVDCLLDGGNKVRVFDRLPERYSHAMANVDYHIGHFGDAFSMAEALYGIDVVYHLVSTTVPSTSNLDPSADVRDNLLATIVLLEQMVKAGVRRIIYLSSGGTVYGNPIQLPITEGHPLNPICSYGIVKVAVENYLFMFRHLYGLSPVVFRPSNPFGPRQGHIGVQGLIATFLHRIMKEEPLIVWGDGSVIRDYLYVTDLAHLIALAGQSQITGIFNAGYGSGFSVNQIIQIISDVTGKSYRVHFEPARVFDVKEVALDITKSKDIFSWVPEVSLREGIKLHWEWIRETKSQ